MNLFFRLLAVFIRASLAKGKTSLLEPVRLSSRVMLTDQDMFAHMTNSRYFSFSDLGVINYIVRTGFWPILRKRGWFPVVCAESVVFSRMLRWRDRFEVETRLVAWSGPYICLQHDFSKKGKATATVRIVARFASRNRKQVSMDDITEALDINQPSPPLPGEFETMIMDVENARAAKTAEAGGR